MWRIGWRERVERGRDWENRQEGKGGEGTGWGE